MSARRSAKVKCESDVCPGGREAPIIPQKPKKVKKNLENNSKKKAPKGPLNENHSHCDSHSHLQIKRNGTIVPFLSPYLTASNSVARSLAFAFTRESHEIPRADSICRTTVAFLTTGSDALRSSLT